MKKSSAKRIVIIGAGNVASALGAGLAESNKVIQIYSKHLASAKKLGKTLACSFTVDVKKIVTDADIYIIAVKDDAIEQVAKKLRLKDRVVVHTSGSIDVAVLKKVSSSYGVLYPLQTFSGGNKLKPNTPFCIEASNEKVKQELAVVIKELSGKAYYMNSVQRAKLHLAAVFVNNFTNHLFAVANDITEKAHIPFDILLPLIEETVNKLKIQKPVLSQTGPAIRNDKQTLKKHLVLLKTNKQYLKLYERLTNSIQSSAKNGAKKL